MKSKRLSILNKQEYEDLYGLPQFTKDERVHFFSLNDEENIYLKRLPKPHLKAYFILQLGYFKAKQRFFDIDPSKHYQDLRYIRSQILGNKQVELQIPSKNSRSLYRTKILKLTDHKIFDDVSERSLKKFSEEASRRNLKPRAIFSEILDYIKEARLEVPDYTFLCDLIGMTIADEHKRLGKIVFDMTKDCESFFDRFLRNSDNFSFSSVKQEPKNLKFKEISEEINRHEDLAKVFPIAESCLKSFEVSSQNIKYLASLASHYKISSLRSFPQDFSSVIICCYVYFRFQRSVDTLVDAYMYYLSKIKKLASEHAKNEVYKQHQELKDDAEKIADLLDIFTDKKIPSKEKFSKIKTKAFNILSPEAIERYSDFLRKEFISSDAIKWGYYSSKHMAFKKNLRPLLMALDFYSDKEKDPLLEAISLLREHIRNKTRILSTSNVPKDFIPNRLKKLVFEDKTLNVDSYEFMIYSQIARRIEAKDLFVKNSTKFLSLAEDLIPEDKWNNRAEFLKTTPFKKLTMDPIDILNSLESELEKRLEEVNRNIEDGSNDSIIIKEKSQKNRWSLPYQKKDESDSDGLFDLLDPVSISDVISYVHQRTGFLNCFNHIQPRFAKSKFSLKNAAACLVAAGSNLGLRRMSEIADIKLSTLISTHRNYFSSSCIRQGSKKLVNEASRLKAYKHFQVRSPGTIHAGADGQKFGVKKQIQQARHSSKYFGKDIGIVAYSLIADHLPINAKTFAPNEHESHFLFDLVFNNNTEIDPEIVSTDMHGVNHVNFAILYMFGRQFAPRYTSLPSRFHDLRGFKDPKYYEGKLLICPQKKVNRNLIISEWENIMRILLSLAMKETSQSIIIRKLSSHRFSDRTKRALWELDSILKSIYLLDYLDSKHLRQDVQRVQNRTEAYHQLKRAIANIAGGKFRGSNSLELEVWNESARLLTNCIIYYNTDLLSRIIDRTDADPKVLEQFNRISPVAWQHINFLGKYEFSEEAVKLDLDQMISSIDLSIFNKVA